MAHRPSSDAGHGAAAQDGADAEWNPVTNGLDELAKALFIPAKRETHDVLPLFCLAELALGAFNVVLFRHLSSTSPQRRCSSYTHELSLELPNAGDSFVIEGQYHVIRGQLAVAPVATRMTAMRSLGLLTLALALGRNCPCRIGREAEKYWGQWRGPLGNGRLEVGRPADRLGREQEHQVEDRDPWTRLSKPRSSGATNCSC